MKNERGVTLIVLVITIIIMVVLATVSLKMLLNSDDKSAVNTFEIKIDESNNKVDKQKNINNSILKYQENEWGL